MMTGDDRDWISFRQARTILAVGYSAIVSLVESGRLTVRKVPGSIPRVLRSEVEALADACTAPAKSA